MRAPEAVVVLAAVLAGPACRGGEDRSARSGEATSTATTATASVAEASRSGPPPSGPRLVLQSELTAYEVRAFRRRSRLRLPRYRDTMKTHAAEHGLDWRLVASVAYVESHFDPLARSFTGVRGLMQLTRNTAERMGVDNRLDPAQSIRGGVAYLARLHGLFKELIEFHRTMIAMASYNVGYGHVLDAQRLARWAKQDPERWPVLAKHLPRLSNPDVAKYTRYGTARGQEPVDYVRSICNYFVLQKRDACRRRDALGDLVLGKRRARSVKLPSELAERAEDGVVTLDWSHPFACGMSDCAVLLQEAHVKPDSAGAES